VLSFTCRPGVGTLMRGPGQEMTIPGKDFADALLSVWLSPKPIGGALKRQLLGRIVDPARTDSKSRFDGRDVSTSTTVGRA
jgi:Chalcone isomerase-like